MTNLAVYPTSLEEKNKDWPAKQIVVAGAVVVKNQNVLLTMRHQHNLPETTDAGRFQPVK